MIQKQCALIFTDFLLIYITKNIAQYFPNSRLNHVFPNVALTLVVCLQVIGDLFTAGMETIKTTLEWTVVYMLRNPRVAKAVQEELDQVVGRNRLPTLRDREFLPYTEATILEVLRISSVVPLGSTHAVTRYVCSCNEEGRF